MFGSKKVTKLPDGREITETKNKKQVSYPNGDFEVTDKKRGGTTSFSRIRPDGKRERDGK